MSRDILCVDVFNQKNPEHGDPPRCHMGKHFGFCRRVPQALLYSVFGVVIEKARGAEDDLNTIVAGTMTGILYQSPEFLEKKFREEYSMSQFSF